MSSATAAHSAATIRYLPREHGTWAMLLVPWTIAVGMWGRVELAHGLLLLAGLAFFLAHTHALTLWRARLSGRFDAAARVAGRLVAILVGVGLGAAVGLAYRTGLGVLLPYAALAVLASLAALWLVRQRVDHGFPGQLLAAVVLPAIAPAAWTVASGRLDRVALALWLLNVAFFVGAVAYVRLKIAARARRMRLSSRTEKWRFAWQTVLVDVILLVLAALALRLGGFSPLGLVAFATVTVQTVAGIVRLDRPAVLKRVGILATAHAILFAILLVSLA